MRSIAGTPSRSRDPSTSCKAHNDGRLSARSAVTAAPKNWLRVARSEVHHALMLRPLRCALQGRAQRVGLAHVRACMNMHVLSLA
jgi:hypothetical protein